MQYPADFEPPSGISPQVGGFMSSPTPFGAAVLQRSFINDVSPPSSLASSSISYDCGNSLITSGDFSNISCLLNNMDISGGVGSGGGSIDPFARMNSFRRSRFAHRLADFDEELKDNSIAKTDMHGIVEVDVSSGNSTLTNSVEGDATFVAANKTFSPVANETFVKPPPLLVNCTYEKISDETFSAELNRTFTPPQLSPTEAIELPSVVLRMPQSTPAAVSRGGVKIQVSQSHHHCRLLTRLFSVSTHFGKFAHRQFSGRRLVANHHKPANTASIAQCN